MKVRLNLATSPLESNRRFVVGATVLGILGMLALFLLYGHAYRVWSTDRQARSRQTGLEKQIVALKQQRQSLASYFEQADNVKRRQRAAYLNGLIEQRAFPWIKIFMDLERTLPEGVRIVSIEPKLSGDNVQIKLTVGATTDEGKLKFLKLLERSQEFSNLQLLTESRPTRPDQTDRVMMELTANYSSI